MSNNEALSSDPAISTSAPNEESQAFSYEREDGTIEYAVNEADAIARCPVLREMEPDQRSLLLELSAIGKDIIEGEKDNLLSGREPVEVDVKEKLNKKEDNGTAGQLVELETDETKNDEEILLDQPEFFDEVSLGEGLDEFVEDHVVEDTDAQVSYEESYLQDNFDGQVENNEHQQFSAFDSSSVPLNDIEIHLEPEVAIEAVFTSPEPEVVIGTEFIDPEPQASLAHQQESSEVDVGDYSMPEEVNEPIIDLPEKSDVVDDHIYDQVDVESLVSEEKPGPLSETTANKPNSVRISIKNPEDVKLPEVINLDKKVFQEQRPGIFLDTSSALAHDNRPQIVKNESEKGEEDLSKNIRVNSTVAKKEDMKSSNRLSKPAPGNESRKRSTALDINGDLDEYHAFDTNPDPVNLSRHEDKSALTFADLESAKAKFSEIKRSFGIEDPPPSAGELSIENLRNAVEDPPLESAFVKMFSLFLEGGDFVEKEGLNLLLSDLRDELNNGKNEKSEESEFSLVDSPSAKRLLLFLDYEAPEVALEQFDEQYNNNFLTEFLSIMPLTAESDLDMANYEPDLSQGEDLLSTSSEGDGESKDEIKYYIPSKRTIARTYVELYLMSANEKYFSNVDDTESEHSSEDNNNFESPGQSNGEVKDQIQKAEVNDGGQYVQEDTFFAEDSNNKPLAAVFEDSTAVINLNDLDSVFHERFVEITDDLGEAIKDGKLVKDGSVENSELKIAPEVVEKALILLDFLGYDDPEKVLIKYSKENSTDELLKMLRQICAIKEVDDDKSIEKTLWSVSQHRVIMPSFEAVIPYHGIEVTYSLVA